MILENQQIYSEIDEFGVQIISFTGIDEDGSYFMIQDSDEDNAQDISLGMNNYYMERDDQSLSCYGGIEKIEFNDTFISFFLDEKGMKALSTQIIKIELDSAIGNIPTLIQELKKLIRKRDIKHQ